MKDDYYSMITDSIILELDKMERLIGTSYSSVMMRFSRFLRQEVWTKNNAVLLNAILQTLNIIVDLFYKEVPMEEYELIVTYIRHFKYTWIKFAPFHPTMQQWSNIERKVDELITGIIIKKQWDILNPYVNTDKEEFNKDLLTIFGSMYQNSIIHNEEVFTRIYKDIKYMYRGAPGRHNYTRLLPNPQYARLNRWNPAGRCFVYAAIEDDYNLFDKKNNILHGEMICLEELRTKYGQEVTLCELEFVRNALNKRVFDFSYNDISILTIESQTQEEQMLLTKEIIDSIRLQVDNKSQSMLTGDIEKLVAREVRKRAPDTLTITGKYATKTLLKMISDTIYKPLDSVEDTDPMVKERCYGAFHVVADYIEKMGYSGIIYPSTRATLINQVGKNIVLFNYNDITFKPGSLKTITYNGYS